MNNTKYDSTWLVTWVDAGIRYNETCDWRGMADDIYLSRKAEFGNATLDELVPEGAKTLDMSNYDFGDEVWCVADLKDDSCDWCGHEMKIGEGGNCCTTCFMEMEARAGVM